MSAKALDYPQWQIESSDDLESFFHVLLYIACMFIDSTCKSRVGFMTEYFDSIHRQGSYFYCGESKRSAMCGGVVRCPDGTPLLFIRPAEQGDRLSGSRLRSGSASSSHPPALASSQVEDTPAAQRGLRLHPIQKIFDQLLPLFEARYVRH